MKVSGLDVLREWTEGYLRLEKPWKDRDAWAVAGILEALVPKLEELASCSYEAELLSRAEALAKHVRALMHGPMADVGGEI